MGLRDLSFPVVTVQTPGGDFAVRGLSVNMVSGVYQRHRTAVSALFNQVTARHAETQPQDAGLIMAGMVNSAPAIMAEVIALASGSKPSNGDEYAEDVAIAAMLPLPVQVNALQKIADQTFTSDMPPGKLLAVVIKLAGDATAVLPKPNG